ncbi:MAG: CoA transferase [Paludibacterium sp.]|uniref:CoA transferase n=1 Tax=Paludibacterium sp. TaxID=1917523 RepID=UPI0025E873D8|nr:CoA transferase [Paludibacterium sp.]MBV8045864.1 CoA transferase [Paludibacterium sp.]
MQDVSSTRFEQSEWFLQQAWAALRGASARCAAVRFGEDGALPSVFATSDLAAGSVAVAALALAEWRAQVVGLPEAVVVDRRLASLWFASSLRPIGWALPPVWDAVAGDYLAQDGWIRLHTNAPHHRQAALAVLGVAGEREAVARAVRGWSADALESAVVAAGGCAAVMRDHAAWLRHPQGRAVADAPLVSVRRFDAAVAPRHPAGDVSRPLAGIRVLDLTRIIAGPVATRFLAAAGADVLRIDPPRWEEPGAEQELTVGKRTARLDLKTTEGLSTLTALLADADVLIHGYRSDALDRLGLDEASRRAINPSLVEVALDAYGWEGPWAMRRGFDSLVQMSCGIAEAGMRVWGRDRPTPLPVQALDHAAGYLVAAAALRGLTEQQRDGHGWLARTSLARVAEWLQSAGQKTGDLAAFSSETALDLTPAQEMTGWGPARRLRMPAALPDIQWCAMPPARPLGSDQPVWPAMSPCSQSMNS